MKIKCCNNVRFFYIEDSDGKQMGRALLTPWRGGWFLFRLEVNDSCRRQGVGTSIIQGIIEEIQDAPLYLEPDPFGDTPMTVIALRDWYHRLGFEMFSIKGEEPNLMRRVAKLAPRRLRGMLSVAMRHPEQKVVRIVYLSGEGNRTERTISPIRFEKGGKLLVATCCGRGEVRQFVLNRIAWAEMREASDVLMPEGVTEKQ